MQGLPIFSEVNDLKASGNGIHAKIGALHVFNSQYNIGYEIYTRWLKRGKFGDGQTKMYSKLNLIFVGPSYADLRDQTAHDIAELAKELKLFGEVPQNKLMKHVKSMIFNSSSLKEKKQKHVVDNARAKDGEQDNSESENAEEIIEEPLPKDKNRDVSHIPFLTGLKSNDAFENLHLIIHDEAHWGIKANSLLEKFFLRVLSIMGEFDRNCCPTLLVLLVSATSDVLFKPVSEFDTSCNLKNIYAVDWNGLNHSSMSQFVVPSYRAVDHLTYKNDLRTSYTQEVGRSILLAECKTQIQRSACVCLQYKTAADDLSQCIGNFYPLQNDVYLGDMMELSYTHWMLASLLGCDKEKKNAVVSDIRGDYTIDAVRNKIVLVRVASIADADELADSVKASFRQKCGILPFEVISLGGNGNIEGQLSERGRAYLKDMCGETVDKNSRVAVLQHIPTLLVVVRKLQMGERLPSSCCYYDVRVPYQGSYDEVVNGSHAQFVQDVGRLAGHKNSADMPTVLLSLVSDEIPTHEHRSIPSFKVTHKLLTPGLEKPTKYHSEFIGNANIYSKMLQYSILLNASPQIGKTGSFLALIEIIEQKQIRNGAYVPPQPESDATSQDEVGVMHGTFSQRCKFLRHLLRTEGMARMAKVMSGNYFKQFHSMLLESRVKHERNTNDLIIVNILFKLRGDLEQASWRILDCGCGIHGLAPSLNLMMSQGKPKGVQKLANVNVCGVDLDNAIRDCVPFPHQRLKFEPYVADFLCLPVDADGFDLVVFNCSLWQQSSSAALSWANLNLRVRGHLVIVELKRRLPKTWAEDMIAMGWAISTEFEEMQYSVSEHGPYIMSVWQKPNAGELVVGLDLLMVEC